MDEHPYYGGGATDAAPGALTDMGVRSKAAEDLSAQPAAAKLEGATIVSARAADSQTAVVTLQARSRPPFLPWGIVPAEGFTITATGSAPDDDDAVSPQESLRRNGLVEGCVREESGGGLRPQACSTKPAETTGEELRRWCIRAHSSSFCRRESCAM